MSRLAKKPIIIPEKTTVTLLDHVVTVKGPLGTLSRAFPKVIDVAITEGQINVSLNNPSRDFKALLGTACSHIKNMIAGVNKVYEKKLIIEGIGYKADAKGQLLTMALGFSHPVKLEAPEGVTVVTEKGSMTISGISKEAVGQFAATVRSWKVPEPYKGKGIRYSDEVIRRKQGKKTA
ncbi:MAG: 50S ribosomal protein L6 [Candidatus Lloydbacteria bacterium RIFCSPHIGHO2_01_FULL_49_22]|uniref:50S ribosomal protein L6 n=1 Tax=Candidatus Lloydbacteria bacterium RIFCSPHIGHO2_01_FULL_49_22 TaxID=1798658 RepID=A0A1G2CY61_9BACT|nr:MAG: 50S ribosomal protein L6 [Candidatus Lloydbacteria bacterium RIFCSPHIGHO2_01_FULL_49_22]OGZ09394.1 MAG: 50S ribosomal protein L6 [Candidatus Lloydbacteria bacterium RIFCSPHIGHO2_02_FULL_50_18]